MDAPVQKEQQTKHQGDTFVRTTRVAMMDGVGCRDLRQASMVDMEASCVSDDENQVEEKREIQLERERKRDLELFLAREAIAERDLLRKRLVRHACRIL